MVTTRNPTHGTKVTDPNAPETFEGAGAVASDSLAADSTRAGGGFSENRNSEPQGVSGSNSTFANTDTSGATVLGAAVDREARSADSGSYPDALGGQAKDLAVSDTAGSSDTGIGGTSSAGVAPSYVNSQFVDEKGPKGKNLTEGGFESNDSKNASFNGDIGGKNDPGRLAEQQFQRSNVDGDSAGMPKQEGDIGDNAYDALGRDASA